MDHWSFAFLVSGMLRNIPNKVDQPLLKRIVDSSFYGKYDFMYLRIDFANDYNVGYAFINFVKAEYIVDFVQPLGHRRRMTTSKGMAFFGARHVETDGSYVYVCFEDLRGITNFHDVFEQACTSGISRRLELCDTPTPDIEEVQAFTEDLQARGMIFGARHVETDGSHVYVCFEDLRGIINFHNAFEQACKSSHEKTPDIGSVTFNRFLLMPSAGRWEEKCRHFALCYHPNIDKMALKMLGW
ncbi:hypothetical protein ACHAPD_008465 [Fusarium lateritium]